jgi:hypothetical protein
LCGRFTLVGTNADALDGPVITKAAKAGQKKQTTPVCEKTNRFEVGSSVDKLTLWWSRMRVGGTLQQCHSMQEVVAARGDIPSLVALRSAIFMDVKVARNSMQH